MKLTKTKPAPAPEFPDIRKNPEYAAAAALLAAFEARRVRVQQEIELLTIESYFAVRSEGMTTGDTSLAGTSDRDKASHARMIELQRLPPYDTPDDTDPQPLDIPSVKLARGIALLRGQHVEPQPARPARRARAQAHLKELRDAISEQSAVLEDIRDRLSFDMSNSIRAWYETQLLDLFGLARAMSDWADTQKEKFAEASLAGYALRGDILPAPRLTAPLVLGSEQSWDSEISTFRRFLIGRGTL